MREHLGFLRVSSLVVKIVAWVFLLAGVLGVVSMALGKVPHEQTKLTIVALAMYLFFFFFLYLIAKMADLLIGIIKEIKKE